MKTVKIRSRGINDNSFVIVEKDDIFYSQNNKNWINEERQAFYEERKSQDIDND